MNIIIRLLFPLAIGYTPKQYGISRLLLSPTAAPSSSPPLHLMLTTIWLLKLTQLETVLTS